MKQDRNLVIYFLFICIAIVELVFIFLVPPFQKPDEETHFLKAMVISKRILWCNKQKGNTVLIENQYSQLIKEIASYRLPLNKQNKIPLSNLYRHQFFASDSMRKTTSINIDHLCYFPIISYLPQSIALSFASSFHINAYYAFFLGRFIMGLLAFCLLIFLFKKIPNPYRNLFLFFIFIPMFLHQVTSYSPDAVHFLFGLIFFVFLLNKMGKEKVGYYDLIHLFFISLLFLLSKTGGHELFPFFILLIPYKRFEMGIKKYSVIMIVFFLFLFSMYGATKIGAYDSYMNSALSGIKAQPNLQVQQIMNNPFNYLLVIAHTTLSRSVFYFQGMFGLFGWLEYGLPHVIYFVYITVFIYIALTTRIPNNRKLSFIKQIYLSSLIVLSYVYLLSIFYIVWTPMKHKIVEGVQGRYFLALFPFIGLAGIQLKCKKTSLPSIPLFVTIILILLTTISILYTVIFRYYL